MSFAADDPEARPGDPRPVIRSRVRRFVPGGKDLTDDQLEALVAGPGGAQARHMMRHTIVGDTAAVARGLSDFAGLTDPDEVMVTNQAIGLQDRLRALGSSPPR